MKRGFKGAILGAIFYSVVGFSILTLAQQRPSPWTPPPTQVPPPAQVTSQQQQLQLAMDAVAKLRRLNAALQQRVQELEAELAACKSQTQAPKPQTEAPKPP
jgi:hypothetical protein